MQPKSVRQEYWKAYFLTSLEPKQPFLPCDGPSIVELVLDLLEVLTRQ